MECGHNPIHLTCAAVVVARPFCVHFFFSLLPFSFLPFRCHVFARGISSVRLIAFYSTFDRTMIFPLAIRPRRKRNTKQLEPISFSRQALSSFFFASFSMFFFFVWNKGKKLTYLKLLGGGIWLGFFLFFLPVVSKFFNFGTSFISTRWPRMIIFVWFFSLGLEIRNDCTALSLSLSLRKSCP